MEGSRLRSRQGQTRELLWRRYPHRHLGVEVASKHHLVCLVNFSCVIKPESRLGWRRKIHFFKFTYNLVTVNLNNSRQHRLTTNIVTAARLILQQPGTLLFNTSWTGFTSSQSAIGLTSKSPLWLTRQKTLSSGHPAYLRELISPYQPSRSLRSTNQLLLTVPVCPSCKSHNWSARFLLFILCHLERHSTIR